MNENDQHNPYLGGDDPNPPGAPDNPYFTQRASAPPPDLDAAAPSLRSAEAQRVNRKALGFLAGIIGLIMVMAYLMFRGTPEQKPKSARSGKENVVIPEVPVAPEATAGEPLPPAQPIGVQPYEGTTSGLPPLPPEPIQASPSYGGGGSGGSDAYGIPAGAGAPPPPSLLQRRMGVADASGGTGAGGYGQDMGQGMAPGMPGQPAGAPVQVEQEKAGSATFLQHPDAMMVRGTYLRCVLETHIVTDVAGYTSCIVTEPVYSFNGRNLLLPKGSKILGSYAGEPDGPRVAVVWDRVITPTGIDVSMKSPGVDNLGGAGHPGDYDAHWASRITSALLISMLSDGFKYAAAKNGPPTVTVGNGFVAESPFESNTAKAMERMANEAINKSMRRPATVTINQGTVVNVYVAKDVDFTNVLGRR